MRILKLQEIKSIVSQRILPEPIDLPDSYKGVVSAFSFSYSFGRTILRFCRSFRIEAASSRVLIVGAHGGRDYYWLTGHGYSVDVLDLGDFPWGVTQYIGDACKPETWDCVKTKYDLVLMCDVLEHLPEDFVALQQVKRVLKQDGYLFISVPYSHDPEVTHVRSYSKTTLRRLVNLAGYDCVWALDRPGLLEAFPRLVNSINYGTALLLPSPNLGAAVLEKFLKVEFFLNEKTRSLYRVLGRSPQKGIILAVRAKCDSVPDYVETNRDAFIPAPLTHSQSQISTVIK